MGQLDLNLPSLLYRLSYLLRLLDPLGRLRLLDLLDLLDLNLPSLLYLLLDPLVLPPL